MNLKPERINELIKRYDFRLNLFWRLTMIKLLQKIKKLINQKKAQL